VISEWIGVLQLALFVVTGLVALRSSRLPQRTARAAGVIGLAGSAAAAGLAVTKPDDAAVAAASLWTGLLLLATVTVIVRRIVSVTTVTAQSIYGAISAYLIIGLMFAAFYAAISKAHGGHFFADGRAGNSQTFQYFSFTTLTTLGYGDFTAAGNDGRAVAVIEALTGQIFLATLVARLVAAFRVAGVRGGGRDGPDGRDGRDDGDGRPDGDGRDGGDETGGGAGVVRGGRRGHAGARARTRRSREPRWRRAPRGREAGGGARSN
jgi:hypothetical protein